MVLFICILRDLILSSHQVIDVFLLFQVMKPKKNKSVTNDRYMKDNKSGKKIKQNNQLSTTLIRYTRNPFLFRDKPLKFTRITERLDAAKYRIRDGF
jgi:hypothetical protein